MASIVKKKIKGQYYFYLVESKRVDGKSRYVNQIYLGTADTIKKKLDTTGSRQALYSEIESFGDVCLLYDLIVRLDLEQLLEKCLPKRNQGVSLATYTIIAAINRAVAPTAKTNIAEWYDKTILKTLIPLQKQSLSAQRFWDNMDLIQDEHIQAFEEMFLEQLVHDYDIDTSHLIYDATNFFTFMDAGTESELAKTGHSKENRTNLKIVGLSMMITPDFNMPLLYDVYPGNTHDSVEFKDMIMKMKERYACITGKSVDVTVTFDRGNNAEDNIKLLEDGHMPFHYVGGLRLSQVNHLLDIPRTKYSQLRLPRDETKPKVYRTTMSLYGKDLTVLVTYDESLKKKQMHTFKENMEKTCSDLNGLKKQLDERVLQETIKGKAMTRDSVSKRLKKILSREHMSSIFIVEIDTTIAKDKPIITFSLDKKASDSLVKQKFGKRAFFTNRHEWTNEEIVGAYGSAWHVESAFRQLKDTDYLTVRPLFHWTDQKIKVHIFFCILAYRLCCLINKELENAGIEVSIHKMLDYSAEIRKVLTVFGTKSSDVVLSLSRSNDIGEKIVDFFNLKAKYLS